MDVCIAGAGIGGLALARGLVADGHRVRVFERASGPSTDGAAVTIFSNGMAAAAGLGIDLGELGGDIRSLRMRRADGRRLMQSDLAPMRRSTGYPVRTIARADLIRCLGAGLGPEIVQYGRPIASVRVETPGVVIGLASGAQHPADLLVGADGHRSPTRAAVLDPAPAADVGWATWQGLGAVLPAVAAGAIGELVVGDAGLVGMMPAGNGLTQWWFDTHWTRDDPSLEPLAMLRDRFAGYADPVTELLASVAADDLGRYPHVRHRVPDQWGRGAVTLLGDAAHAFPPSQAQGANQALEDAWVLRRALTSGPAGDDVELRLREYERQRSVRVRRVARLAASERTNRPPGVVLATLARMTPAGLGGRAQLRLLRSFSDVLNQK
jgi:FAD-dependent urate hydroxylase